MKKNIIIFFLMIVKVINVYGQNGITVESKPKAIYIEKGEYQQYINFDFLIKNNTADTLSLSGIKASIYNNEGLLVQEKFVDNNGTAPSIALINNKMFEKGSSKLIFNPFAAFDPDIQISQIKYQFTFAGKNEEAVTVTTEVHPQIYTQGKGLYFPLTGDILVYDGHDFYAHHRRFDYEFQPIKDFGLSTNFMRYAYDFVLLNHEGKQYAGEGKNNTDYFGYGKAVQAVDEGTVIYANNTFKDDKNFDPAKLKNNPLELYGNSIAILHSNGAISIYGHLMQNSLKVKKGDKVTATQQIASIGVSGSSFFPHLHFEMRTSIDEKSEGLPSYFKNIYTRDGKKIKSGLPGTGSIFATR